MKILLIDDEQDFVKNLEKFLKKLGHETLIAHDGNKALDVFRKDPPDIIMTDIRMPGMDGIQMATLHSLINYSQALGEREEKDGWPLQLGYTDNVEASIADYKKAMQAAGIDKVVEECQKQLDAYIAAQK